MIIVPVEAPFFSVIMTTYNRADLIGRALDSLIGQTEKDWELILVNDGSTDETTEVIQPYLQKYAKITYKYQKNNGFIAGKNTGIGLAKGQYITFLDSDDEYAKTHLETRKRLLKTEPDIDLLHGGVKIIGPEFVPDANNPDQLIHLSNCAISGTFFIKHTMMTALNSFAGNHLTTDADFMIRAEQSGFKIVKTDMPTYVYHRDVESSITLDLLKNK